VARNPGRLRRRKKSPIFLCEKSYQAEVTARAIVDDQLGDLDVLNLENITVTPQLASQTKEQLFEKFFATCKIAMLVSDGTSDGILDKNEYVVEFIDMVGSSFEKLDQIFQGKFKEVSLRKGIDIAGTKIGDVPSDDEVVNLRSICTKIDLVA
jgi:hypothetical protein